MVESIEDDKEGEDETVEEFQSMRVYTLDRMMLESLCLIGYTEQRIGRAKKTTNIEQLKAHFGSIPRVVALIWEDLQIGVSKDAWVPPSKRILKHLLMALHHLKQYPTEIE